jgi:hypothetical protein
MSEYLKDPFVIQCIIAGINIIAAIIVIIASFNIRRDRRDVENVTKLLSSASDHLQESFSSMLKTISSIEELRKLSANNNKIQETKGDKK